MEDLFQKMRSHSDEAYVGEGVDEGLILLAEQALGVKFPSKYRTFLEQIGAAAWPRDLYGLVETNDRFLNVVKLTSSEREDMEPALPHHLLAISPDGWGNHFCLDTSSAGVEDCPVVLWNHERATNQIPRVVSPGFEAWLEGEIDSEEADE